MSNSIGGSGGGGGGFDIGGMLGGLIGGIGGKGAAEQNGGAGAGASQSNPMGMLQGLLDPLGIFPALGGGIGKLLKGADPSQISVEGKRINELAAFDQNQAGATKVPGDATEPPVEYPPPKDPTKAGAGYGDKIIQQLDQVSQDFVTEQQHQKLSGGVKQESQSMTGKGQRQSSSAAATAGTNQDSQAQTSDPTRSSSSSNAQGIQTIQTPEQETAAAKQQELKAMKTISAHFDAFDQNTFKDGLFDQRNIEDVAANGSTAEVRAAAKYLLDHPDLMLDLQVATGRGHGLLSLDAITARMHTLLGITNIGGGTDPTGGTDKKNGTSGKDGANGKDGAAGSDGANGKNGVDETDGPDDAPPLVGADAKTLEDCLEDIGGSMDQKEKNLIKLL
ncbi:MAG: hypothetical protein H6Q89_1100, partial [Myxococcaceae bacterium]|nr:hypothetical protein [Myxococcaceae bacterium]